MNIVVLAGGLSPEREVSLTSGSLIANALMENGHSVLLVDVYEGIPALPDRVLSLFRTAKDERYSHSVSEEIPDLDALRARCNNGAALIGPNVIALCQAADLAFLALHGAMGENGQLQATLDAFGIPYTGSGYAGSLLAMDKDVSKRLFRFVGVPTPEWVCYDARTMTAKDVADAVGLPCVVKPCGCGSSVGVSMADTMEELAAALEAASEYGTVIVERKITGRELTVGVLDGETLPVVEIIPTEGFYDYKNKYQGTTREVCPAEIDDATARKASELALLGFDALHLKGYARFDFLLDGEGELWCLEANTLPGMTPTSLFPFAASKVGISYNALCERLVLLAMEKMDQNI